jgi:iron complex outermembrane receptor protein
MNRTPASSTAPSTLYNYENFQTTVQHGVAVRHHQRRQGRKLRLRRPAELVVDDQSRSSAPTPTTTRASRRASTTATTCRLSPDNRASVGLIWTLPVAGGSLEFQPTYTWQSEMYFDDNNDRPELQTRNFVPDTVVDELQKSYGLLNLRIRYAPDGANWGVEAFGDNLTDEKFIKDAGNTGDGLGLPTFIAGEPRTYGASITVRY